MPNISVSPGAESFFFEGNEVGCLVIHGFSSTPQVVRYYGEFLAQEGGFTVSGPRLPGHGTTVEDLAQKTIKDFLRTLERQIALLRQRCSEIFVTGLSLGGLLTLYLAATYPDLFSGAIPINGGVFNDKPDIAMLIYASNTPPVILNEAPDIKKSDVHEIVYPGMPIPTLRGIYTLAGVTLQLLPRLTCPLLIFQSRVDHLLAPENGPYIFEHVASKDKRLVWLENSYHVATLDNDKEFIAYETMQFIQRHL